MKRALQIYENQGELKLAEVAAKQKMDMLHGTIWNKLVLFALPVAATGILEQLFNASDIAIVGNFTGDLRTVSVAAIGATTSIIGFLLNIFMGIALGANVVIANAVGRRDNKTITKAVHTSIIMALLCGVLVTAVGEICIAPLLMLLNVPPDVLPYALLYIRIYLLGMPAILLYNFEAAIFRSVGETKVPLKALAFSGVLNVLLNLFLVIVFNMSVNGVAIATVTANVISSVFLLRKLTKTDSVIRVSKENFRCDRAIFIQIIKIGLPAGVQSAVFAAANIIVQSAINSLGTVVIAGSSAAFNIEIMAFYVLNSFSQACTTFVGQNYGAGNLKRCRRILLLSIVEDLIATAAAILLVLSFGRQLLSIFSSDPAVIDVGYTRMLIIFSAYTFSMLYDNMSAYMRGFGISLSPALITIICVCGIRIFWIYAVFPAHQTFSAIMTVYPVSLSVTALLIFVVLMIHRPSRKLQLQQ